MFTLLSGHLREHSIILFIFVSSSGIPESTIATYTKGAVQLKFDRLTDEHLLV